MPDDPLLRHVDAAFVRPLPEPLLSGRRALVEAIEQLRTITDTDLIRPWPWKGGSEEEIRYGFYRISESFELAGIEAQADLRTAGVDRGRAAERIAPSTAARWDLQGLLVPLPESAWDADPGDQEWTIRQTMSHVIQSQRYYGVGTGWWQAQAYAADSPELPPQIPEAVYADMPTEEAEGVGTAAEVRARLDEVVDGSAVALGGLPADRLPLGARWSGFAIDIDHRIGRWSSHMREHTIQVEKTLVMIDHEPTEVDRLIRNVFAAWGRAEAAVYAAPNGDQPASRLLAAAEQARTTAIDLLEHIRD